MTQENQIFFQQLAVTRAKNYYNQGLQFMPEHAEGLLKNAQWEIDKLERMKAENNFNNQ